MGKTQDLTNGWKKLIVGQDHAIEKIVPYIVRGIAGFNPPNRPVGVFFLLGPTGTGKTRTAETLAELLHGTEKNVLRIDCGEFQMEHEVAKLVGAPPGYLGHRETHPMLSQQKLVSVTSEKNPFSIILFDEIEKASPSMWRILLGVLDKATLKLGDNSTVDFQKTIIFMSSNVGASELSKVIDGGFGFVGEEEKVTLDELTPKHHERLSNVGYAAMSRKFPPEFQNRVDEIISYRPLTTENLRTIATLELGKLQSLIVEKLGVRAFLIHYDDLTIDFITRTGTSIKYGARELKRTINRLLLNRMADEYIEEQILPGSDLHVYMENGAIEWRVEPPDFFYEEPPPVVEEQPRELERPQIKRSRKRNSF